MKNYANCYLKYNRQCVENKFEELGKQQLSFPYMLQLVDELGFYESDEKIGRVIRTIYHQNPDQIIAFNKDDFQRICYLIYASGSYHDAVIQFFSMDYRYIGQITMQNAISIIRKDAHGNVNHQKLTQFEATVDDPLRMIDIEEFLLLESYMLVE